MEIQDITTTVRGDGAHAKVSCRHDGILVGHRLIPYNLLWTFYVLTCGPPFMQTRIDLHPPRGGYPRLLIHILPRKGIMFVATATGEHPKDSDRWWNFGVQELRTLCRMAQEQCPVAFTTAIQSCNTGTGYGKPI
jgi:hypothetical protein